MKLMLVINSIQFFISELFPGFKTTPLTLEEVFGAPGMREIALGSGAAAVSERSELSESNYPFHRFCAFRQLQFRRQNYNMGSKMLNNSKNLFLLPGISTSCYPTKVVGMFA